MVSITPFTDGSVEIGCCMLAVTNFLLKLYPSPILPKKHLIVLILNDISLPDLVGWDAWNERSSHWKHMVVAFIVAKFVWVVVSFVGMFC